mgnify:CR=1 FL=1
MRWLLTILGPLGLIYGLGWLMKTRSRKSFTDEWFLDQNRREGRVGHENVRIKFPFQRKG